MLLVNKTDNQTVLQMTSVLYKKIKECVYIITDSHLVMIRDGQITKFKAEGEDYPFYETNKRNVIQYGENMGELEARLYATIVLNDIKNALSI